MNTEKRLQVRKPINVAVNIQEATGGISKAISADISRTGICLYTGKESVEPGQIFHIELAILVRGKYMNIRAEAIVVHKSIHKYHGYTLGLAFTGLDEISNATLDFFIGAYKPPLYTSDRAN